MATVQPLIMADPELITPPDRRLWTTPRMVNSQRMWPTFTPHEVARCFFGMSTAWLRGHLRANHHHSEEFGVIEPPRNPKGHTIYRLYDIERLAYSFTEHEVITPAHLGYTLTIVKTLARIHGYVS